MNTAAPKEQELLSQAYILGGSPCSGKSTIAERLSAQFDLQYYKIDDHQSEHKTRIDPDRHPVMFKYSQMGWNEVWMRPVSLQVQEVFAYYRERFEMIVQDLETIEAVKPIILEGAALIPEMIRDWDVGPKRAIFLVPTKTFQVHHYRQRPWIQQILKDCEDPDQAFENWMMRDHLFGQEILRQAKASNAKTIVVDGRQRIDRLFEVVSAWFGLA